MPTVSGLQTAAAFPEAAASETVAAAPAPKPYNLVTGYRSHKDSEEQFFCPIGSVPLQDLHDEEVGNEVKPSVFVVPDCQVSKPWIGFGGSFTEAACTTLDRLSAAKQDEILRAYFDVEFGLGYTMGRIHIGSCDFCNRCWSCGDISHGDPELSGFSISRYRKTILPMIRKAAKIAGAPLNILASPWSPPTWMKTETRYFSGKLKEEYSGLWAKHFVKFIQEFQQEKVPIWGVTVQNEPAKTGRWESCAFTPYNERDFVRDHLGPSLAGAGLGSVRILVGDHNRDGMLERAAVNYSDPEAAKYIWGVAYHWYGDARFDKWADMNVVQFALPGSEGQVALDVRGQTCFENLRRVAELRPDKHIIFSEGCQELGDASTATHTDDWKVGERYGMNIIADMNNGCEGWIDWNLCLDSRGGPNHASNFCVAPFRVENGEVLARPCYWFLVHFAKFIRPGARRVVCSSSRDALEVTAWINLGDRGAPGSTADNVVVVVLNQSEDDIDFWLKIASSGAVRMMAPARSIHTLLVERAPSAP